ncbi:MAG: GntR family transcriptional regulator [Paludibacter sp.]|nr:GntR family transcriptional regulator [Paludibacter sp.]
MDFKESQAIYLQIGDYIGEQILLGHWKEGDRILSVRELGVALQVNPNTVMRTFDFLQSLDIIFNKRGVGYFVAIDAKVKILEYRKKYFTEQELPHFFKNITILNISIEDIKKQYEIFLDKNRTAYETE